MFRERHGEGCKTGRLKAQGSSRREIVMVYGLILSQEPAAVSQGWVRTAGLGICPPLPFPTRGTNLLDLECVFSTVCR